MKTTVIKVHEVKTEIEISHMIFDDGEIRFNRPVKIVDDGK